jgi:hypothetical protein
MTPSNPGRYVTVHQICKLFGKYKLTATGATAANGCRATGLFPCDMNIHRPHDFPLASGNINAAPVNYPGLVKTSDQPSFNSSNFSPFTPAGVFRLSDINPVPNLNQIQILRWNSKENRELSFQKIYFEATQKEKIKQATKSKI